MVNTTQYYIASETWSTSYCYNIEYGIVSVQLMPSNIVWPLSTTCRADRVDRVDTWCGTSGHPPTWPIRLFFHGLSILGHVAFGTSDFLVHIASGTSNVPGHLQLSHSVRGLAPTQKWQKLSKSRGADYTYNYQVYQKIHPRELRQQWDIWKS